MQAKRYLHGSVALSTEHKGKPRAAPCLGAPLPAPGGKDSRKTLAKAWLKASRPPATVLD